MQLIEPGARVPQASARLVDVEALKRDLAAGFQGELRFDRVSQALYATDASVYEIWPLGVAIPASRDDLLHLVRCCFQHKCPYTLRGGGTSQGGQSIGEGLNVDLSKSFARVLELNAAERWVRVEPGIVLEELNQQLAPHGLRFAPDVSTANRATIGGMISNNSSGARSVIYGKTIDHVRELEVAFSDGSVAVLRDLDASELDEACVGDSLAAQCHRVVRDLARQHADEVRRRFPRVMRRVMGYNLDEFIDGRFNLAKLITGAEGTLAVILSAKLALVPLPKAKSVLTIQFDGLLDSLAATPAVLKHQPSAIEVMDGGILANTKQSPEFARMASSFLQGEPGALLCVEFYGDRAEELPPRMQALEAELRATTASATFFYHATALPDQARIWGVREAALGFSMAMKEDAKSLSFVEDTAVAPERLRDYIDRFQQLLEKHGTTAGVYAHASVGCLHVRPVINLKTEEGVARFRAIAEDVADLVLEFGGALSGEHGDGLIRSPFIRKMFGPVLYEAFRTIKRTFDPRGVLNPGKICDPPPMTDNLRYGAGYRTPNPKTWFDWSEYGGLGGAVDMCSGVAACRKQRGGTMCPSYMATLEEQDSTRGRANMLRLAMNGRLGEAGLGDQGVYQTLDLCLECRACKAECPVGVDVARFKSEFLADYYARHGTPREARLLGNARRLAEMGSQWPRLTNWLQPMMKGFAGIDARRSLPRLAPRTLAAQWPRVDAPVLFFNDTWTNYYDPAIGLAVKALLERAGVRCGVAPNACCGRPLISKGLMAEARAAAERNAALLSPLAAGGARFVFAEPSCLSAVKEDAPALLQGEAKKQALAVAAACVSFEEFFQGVADRVAWSTRPAKVVLHGHCHQKAMGLLTPAKKLFAQLPGVETIDPDAGCCGMAGSFGYTHYDLSRTIAERRLLPAVQAPGVEVVAAGTSCRHQVKDLAGVEARHPAEWLAARMTST